MARPFNVVVWGSSGFTGRLVCEHLAKDYKNGAVSWAMAGRNKQKLEEIRDALAQTYGAEIKDTPILIGDLADPASLDAIAAQTSVLISTAGPFISHGTPIVEAALRQSCDGYVDITGEARQQLHPARLSGHTTHHPPLTRVLPRPRSQVPWVKQLLSAHHEEAAAKGVRIIPCCGYDSIPSDMGAYAVVTAMQERFGASPTQVVTGLLSGAGGVSGGTIATGMLLLTEHAGPGANGEDASSTYALIPAGAERGTSQDMWTPRRSALLDSWLAPFIMQACNTRIVQRSNYLLGWGGAAFDYTEAIMTPGRLGAAAVAAGTAAAVLAFSRKWMHPLLRRFVPAPGQGPTREAMLGGHWRHRVVGEAPSGARVTVEIGDPHRDAGYWGTSRMVLEAALCIALQKADLQADAKLLGGGVLTPASALGGVLVSRLRAAGLEIEVTEARAGGEAAK
jgi:short subunit dehydrogenase-like uncharacterized protein